MIRSTPSSSKTKASPLRDEYKNAMKRLEQIEKRLGTAMERENDLEIAHKIAHRLSNIQMLFDIREAKAPDTSL